LVHSVLAQEERLAIRPATEGIKNKYRTDR
jgi:hypothetical protein